MSRKKVIVPKHVQRAFLNVARANKDNQGHLKETLCFLAGHETSDALIVTDLVFPAQESTGTKVDDKGICGQDSSLWISQMSPAAHTHRDTFRLIAWVHSHVQGAPCGFSSIDVHTQYAYKVMCQGWDIYGLVVEIKEDGTCLTGWFDLTEDGFRCVSQCSISHAQHSQCSSRNFFQDHQAVVNELNMSLTVVDARDTARIGCNTSAGDPIIWTMNTEQAAEVSYKDHDVCKCCGKYLGNLQSMVGHIGRAKTCKAFYGPEYEFMRQKRRNQSITAYNKANASRIAKKQAEYNKEHKEQIRAKQEMYDRDNREKIRIKQDKYNKNNKEVIKNRQGQYDHGHQERIKERQAAYNCDNRKKINEKQTKYNKAHQDKIREKQDKYNKENQDKINHKQKKYDKENKEKIQQKQAKYNRENQVEIKQKQSKYNTDNREKIRQRQAKYNSTNRDKINKNQEVYNKINKKDIAEKELNRKQAKRKPMQDFNCQIASGPIFPCACCHRILFNDGVVAYTSPEELETVIGHQLYSDTIKIKQDTHYVKGKLYLCVNCNLLLKKGKTPAICVQNGLNLDCIPNALKLTELEQQLIAKRLLFLKIHLLPRSRMPAMKDRVINVPLDDEDICQTMQSLPRNIDEAGLIAVKFKRMKKLKSNHLQAFIRPGILQQALRALKELGHPDYQFDIPDKNVDIIDIDSTSSEDEEEDSQKRESENNVRESNEDTGNQLYNYSTCLVHDNLESEVVINNSSTKKVLQCGKEVVEIAPGEGKIPTNILNEKNIDIKAFPCLFPSGKFGSDYERKLKISKQKYYNQRILNIDGRFRESPTYLFAAQHIVEKEQLEKNINIMVQRGQLKKQQDGSHVMQTSDYYAAFQNIRGSPKYFQIARHELLARVAQLGPFQLFFTLSCAEMRWPEVTAVLLQQQGHEVICIDEERLTYVVDGQSLDDYIEHFNISKHELFKNNIVTVTRMFDHRVKKFVQNLLKARNDSIKMDFFNYRIEFQMRGMAHVHGVIWLDEEVLDDFRCSNSSYDSHKIPELIDHLITCHLPEIDLELRKIVEEVQTHHHTKTCKKYNSTCRFGYPRFPSKKTIIAKALSPDMDENERNNILDKHKKVLKKVKSVLEGEENLGSLDIATLLQKANVTLNDYEEALSTSERGVTVVLKRKVSECYINNYNPNWLKAWNANMDLQFCYDPYAVITYICDYYGKDDTGMTDLLKAALKETKGCDKHEMFIALKKAYLTHRQIGACEAAYRLLPNLHMKDSNITCSFVSTGFPENRATFMEKVSDEFNDVEGVSEDNQSSKYVKIEGKNGYFKKRISVHERYAKRPNILKEMCLAQFATMYKLATHRRKKIDMINNSSSLTGNTAIFLTETKLPVEIEFDDEDMSAMQLRGRSSVLRLHESKKKKEEHEYYYAEMLLFHPWRDETNDLHRNNSAKCKRLYKTNFLQINERRKIMFPFLDSVEEAQTRLEEISLENIRSTHIASTLDGEGEKQNEEDSIQENNVADEFVRYHPGDHEPSSSDKSVKEFAHFKVIEIDMPELIHLTRRLIPEQRAVLSKVINFCKKMLRSRQNSSNVPDPFRIILHGGAGSGKSNVIRIVAKWTEKILRRAGDHPNKPKVLLTAPTGTAASIIGGVTLHAAFNFSFGDELKPLSDKKLDELRCLLADVKIIIVDEMSMIRSDMLYQLHLRLCEIFQCKRLFGNKCLLLVGDLLQLQPVRGAYVFQSPRCQRYKPYHEVNPLWEEFDIYVLKHNHRQGEAGHWAEALNRFRVGLVTQEDQEMLQQRLLSEREAKEKDTACHLFFTNREVDQHNAEMLNKLNTQLYEIKAAITVPFGCGSKSQVYGRVHQTAFMETLHIKTGARVMLIHNLSVVDSLTNGAMGTILDIKLQEGKPFCIIIKFDNDEVGAEQRRKHENISKHYGEEIGTPIFKEELQYQLPRGKTGTRQHTATGKLFQFPLRLAWAVTAHKVQGQTFKRNSQIVVHWHKNLAPGMAYVMLGRCESPDDVFIAGTFTSKGIKCNEKAKDMAEELDARHNVTRAWNQTVSLKILLINARSLREHSKDLTQCKEYNECDVLCVTETWLKKEEEICFDRLKQAIFASHSKSRGKGCAIFAKQDIVCTITAEKMAFQLIVAQTLGLQIVLLYRCQKHCISNLLDYLTEHVNFKQPTLLLGDFNVHAGSDKRLLKKTKTWKLIQKVQEATHDEGNILDHVYISEQMSSSCYVSPVPVIFSDHDLVMVEIVL